jgi:two-component system LytT family sensor kinase/two-component system sensor histidine kinase LytS
MHDLIVNLLFDLIKNMAIIAVAAQLFIMETDIFSQVINRRAKIKSKIFLIIFFGLLSILGTYLGIYIHDAYANIRAIGAVVGGLLGGPIVGFFAGLIGGIHRYFLGGFTAFACALSTTLAGLIGGIIYYYRSFDKISLNTGFLLGVIIEVLEMGLVLVLSHPYDQAYELVRIIALPMILSNSLGITLFINVLHNSMKKGQELMALQSYKALKIANKSIGYLKEGLNYSSALETSKIIYEISGVAAVSITDRKKVLAHYGLGMDHHQAGEGIMTKATKEVLLEGQLKVATNKRKLGCPVKDCKLKSAVIAPLKRRGEVIGALKLYKSEESSITEVDIELARGISELLSTQLHISSLEKEAQLATQAELKALQSQVHPHFLFNALNTIISFCRTDPMGARELLVKLSKFFRHTLKENHSLIKLAKELEYTSYYVEIEKARFGSNLEVEIDIPQELLDCEVPSFVLQPIVENAIKHGVSSKVGLGKVLVKARQKEQNLLLEIIDNGVGIPDKYLNCVIEAGHGKGCGIGLSNVKQRIQKIYGTEYGLEISSRQQEGTKVTIQIPYLLKGRESNGED